jgi:hypothetical protein
MQAIYVTRAVRSLRGLRLFLALAVAVVASSAQHASQGSIGGPQSKPLQRNLGVIDGFVARSYRTGVETMSYRLFVPDGYSAQLTVFLTGVHA